MNAWMLQIRGGVERDRYGKKAGKGALIQTDLCPSLGVSLDTTLFQELEMEEMNATVMAYDSYNQAAEEEVCNTLRTPGGGDNSAKVAVRMDLNFGGEVLTDHAQTIRAGASASIGGGVVLEGEEHKATQSFGINPQGGQMLPFDHEISETLAVGHGGGVMSEQESMRYLVRRLTPLECERLMGYPEGHTIPLFGEITDDLVEEFVQVFDDFAVAMGESKKPATKAQVRKWLEKVSNPETCPDAPRYKACGNGWAINCARWVLQGVDSYLRKMDSAEAALGKTSI